MGADSFFVGLTTEFSRPQQAGGRDGVYRMVFSSFAILHNEDPSNLKKEKQRKHCGVLYEPVVRQH